MATRVLLHRESHFRSSDTVRDVVIGIADGLTVPFALAAGVSGAIASSRIIVTAGLAEIAAGAIAMGIGGYLAARSDVDHYDTEYRREVDETHAAADEERAEVASVFRDFGISGSLLDQLVERIAADRTKWVEFMMRFELGLEKPNAKRAPISAFTIGGSYVAGGIIPLAPYILVPNVPLALAWSIGVTLCALFIFGAIKAQITVGRRWFFGGLQTMITGGVAAGVAFALARAIAQ